MGFWTKHEGEKAVSTFRKSMLDLILEILSSHSVTSDKIIICEKKPKTHYNIWKFEVP